MAEIEAMRQDVRDEIIPFIWFFVDFRSAVIRNNVLVVLTRSNFEKQNKLLT
jgi:hypothetical protein